MAQSLHFQFAGNHAEKVLAALLECECESVKQAAHEQLEVGVHVFD
jgi:hypothetical protein